jgi:ribose transport system permease protein
MPTTMNNSGSPGALRRLVDFREFMIIAIILVAGAAMAVLSPDFATAENLSVLLLAVSTQAIVAIGMTVLLVSGEFDLSVGSVAGLAGAVTALAMVEGVPVPVGVAASYPYVVCVWIVVHPIPAVLVGLAVGAFIGLTNGLIIAKVGINPFITTLAMMGIVRGALEVITRGRNIYGLPDAFKWIGQGRLADIQFLRDVAGFLPTWTGQERLLYIQYPILISIAMIVVGDVLLRKSRFFRQNYYIGASAKAALLSGINVGGMRIFNYVLTGLLAAVAGIVMTARFGSASVTMGTGLELQVISAVIIGGASLQGGEGTVLGAFLGCILMALIVTSLNLLGVDIYWQRLVIGATLLAAVMVDTLGKKRKGIA